MTLYRSSLLATPGATELPGDHHGLDAAGVAWHYGDPLTEQRRAHSGGAVVDRSQRRVVKISGEDAATFLNNLLSQKLDEATDGFAASALDLDIQGRILHHVDVTVADGAFYLDTTPAQYDSLVDFLRKMVFWSKVEITDTDLGILSVLGAESVGPVKGAVFGRSMAFGDMPRTDFAVPRAGLAGAVAELELPLAGLMAWTAERVRALEPELAVDLDDKSIAHEVPGLIGRGAHLGAVHLNKGCYRGQETVARVENLGRSPRLMVRLSLDGSAPVAPVPGSEITDGRRVVGRLGTVVDDFEDGPIALGVVKRSALRGGELEIDAEGSIVAAAVDPTSLPSDEGPKLGRQAIARLRSGEQDNH